MPPKGVEPGCSGVLVGLLRNGRPRRHARRDLHLLGRLTAVLRMPTPRASTMMKAPCRHGCSKEGMMRLEAPVPLPFAVAKAAGFV